MSKLLEFWAAHGEAVTAFALFVATLLLNSFVNRYGYSGALARAELWPVVGHLLIATRHLGPNREAMLADLVARSNRVAAERAAKFGAPPPPNAPRPPQAPPAARDLTDGELRRVVITEPGRFGAPTPALGVVFGRETLDVSPRASVSPPPEHVAPPPAPPVSLEELVERSNRALGRRP